MCSDAHCAATSSCMDFQLDNESEVVGWVTELEKNIKHRSSNSTIFLGHRALREPLRALQQPASSLGRRRRLAAWRT
jgi:hypothetical protein